MLAATQTRFLILWSRHPDFFGGARTYWTVGLEQRVTVTNIPLSRSTVTNDKEQSEHVHSCLGGAGVKVGSC